MTLRSITENAGEWLRGAGPHSDVVISSRVRLARNLAGFPFVGLANRRQRYEVLENCREQIVSKPLSANTMFVHLNETSALNRQLLVERHLISRQHGAAKNDVPRGVAVGSDETFAIMVNEEDHLRIQVLRSGMQLSDAFDQINRIDDQLEEKLEYAYSRRFGYLTACPTNVGTGIRVSVMLHLPALQLTGEIDKVKRAARDMHLAVRGLFGEGSDAQGDLYQVSNQTTLGKSEGEILADFETTVVPQIINYELQARQALVAGSWSAVGRQDLAGLGNADQRAGDRDPGGAEFAEPRAAGGESGPAGERGPANAERIVLADPAGPPATVE